jgi:Zn-dependent peptidase ImmA (M78 family)
VKRQQGKISQAVKAKGIELAKSLVREYASPTVPAGERLREIAKVLNVKRIEAGAVRCQGFLKRLPDNSFAIYYSVDCSPAKRRFTVAHELAHLVLEKAHRHVGSRYIGTSANGFRTEVERVVDRIAAELLMPEKLVVETIAAQSQLQRRQSATVQKRAVLQTVGTILGVSEFALTWRILELQDLLGVLLRAQWDSKAGPSQARLFSPALTANGCLEIVRGEYLNPGDLEKEDGWEHEVQIETRWGRRSVRCCAWRRPATFRENGDRETWALGWTSNNGAIPPWDDSIAIKRAVRRYHFGSASTANR